MRDSGSDIFAELEQINSTLVDLTGLLGTGPYGAGSPQRAALDKRIADFAARQAQLSAEAVRPEGWAWQPTGEIIGDWWSRQDVTSRKVWLRSMGVRLGFVYPVDGGSPTIELDFGDIGKMADGLDARGRVADLLDMFGEMREQGVRGLVIDGSDTEVVRQ